MQRYGFVHLVPKLSEDHRDLIQETNSNRVFGSTEEKEIIFEVLGQNGIVTNPIVDVYDFREY